MKLTLNDIFAVIDKVKESGLESFEYKDGDTELRLGGAGDSYDRARRNSFADAAEGNPEGFEELGKSEKSEASTAWREGRETEEKVVVSPMVGTFFAAPAEDAVPFVRAGDQVKAGQTVGIVEAMKLMNEITTEWEGVVEEILVKNGEMVEYGQPLLRIGGIKG